MSVSINSLNKIPTKFAIFEMFLRDLACDENGNTLAINHTVFITQNERTNERMEFNQRKTYLEFSICKVNKIFFKLKQKKRHQNIQADVH